MSGYCDISPGHEWHGPYHDNEYGFPVRDESELFERLILEINQAGLSWLTILKKREGFSRAYDGFDVDIVAGTAVQVWAVDAIDFYGPRSSSVMVAGSEEEE